MTRIILVIIALLISGCSEWSLKRSASNKLIDTKGFEGSKRRPLYNKKYINRAKRNMADNNYDEDEDDDLVAVCPFEVFVYIFFLSFYSRRF